MLKKSRFCRLVTIIMMVVSVLFIQTSGCFAEWYDDDNYNRIIDQMVRDEQNAKEQSARIAKEELRVESMHIKDLKDEMASFLNDMGTNVKDGKSTLPESTFDATKWKTVSSNVSNNLNAVIWFNDKFIAVGDSGTILTSTDGQKWSALIRIDKNLSAIAASGTNVVIGGDGVILTSIDGVKWDMGSGIDGKITDIVYGKGHFVAVGNKSYESTDAKVWTEIKLNANAIDCDGDTFVAVDKQSVFVSSDAVNWAETFKPEVAPPAMGGVDDEKYKINDILWNGKVWIGIAKTVMQDSILFASKDATCWTRFRGDYQNLDVYNKVVTYGALPDVGRFPTMIKWAGNRYIGLGGPTLIYEDSKPACSFVSTSLSAFKWESHFTWKDGKFDVADKNYNQYLDGSEGNLLDIAWNDNACVVVGKKGLIASSVGDKSAQNQQNPLANRVMVNSKNLKLDVAPTIVEGRMLVPLRAIFEALGCEVKWIPESRTVIGGNSKVNIELQLDNKSAKVNGVAVTLDVPAMIIGNRTLIPLRFLSENMGANVTWDGATKTAVIRYNSGSGQIKKSYYEDGKLATEGAYDNEKHNGTCKLYHKNGSIMYFGEMKNGLMDGKGLLYAENGKLQYVGEFKAGKRNGIGRTFYPTGELLYAGGFKDDSFDGTGSAYKTDKTVLYVGSFVAGKPLQSAPNPSGNPTTSGTTNPTDTNPTGGTNPTNTTTTDTNITDTNTTGSTTPTY